MTVLYKKKDTFVPFPGMTWHQHMRHPRSVTPRVPQVIKHHPSVALCWPAPSHSLLWKVHSAHRPPSRVCFLIEGRLHFNLGTERCRCCCRSRKWNTSFYHSAWRWGGVIENKQTGTLRLWGRHLNTHGSIYTHQNVIELMQQLQCWLNFIWTWFGIKNDVMTEGAMEPLITDTGREAAEHWRPTCCSINKCCN